MVNALITSGLIGRQGPKPHLRFIQGLYSGESPADTINNATNGLSSYFELIREAAPSRWDGDRSGLLCTNVGVEAYIRLLGELCSFIRTETRVDTRDLTDTEFTTEIATYLKPIREYIQKATSAEFAARFTVPFGSGGPVRYFFALAGLIRECFPTFNPAGYEEFHKRVAEETVEDAERKLRLIEEKVPSYVIDKLKEIYPDAKFLQRGVKNQSILAKAFEKQMMNPPDEQGPLETYLDFIQFKDIVCSKENMATLQR